MRNLFAALLLLLACSSSFAQAPKTSAPPAPPQAEPTAPAKNGAPAAPAAKPGQPEKPAAGGEARVPDRASAYYHYSLAHIYEELVAMYGRSEFANKAIEEYKLALQADPDSPYLSAGLAELYVKANRIRDAVLEAQEIIKRNPDNLEARRLLGRIYVRTLGDTQAGVQSQQMLKLAIEQYEQIVRLDGSNVDDHLLLGRLYRVNNETPKAEKEFKEALRRDPSSEEAVTSLAYLYNEQGDTARASQVLSTFPDASRTARLYMALGYTYEQQRNFKKAVESYRKAVEQDKDNLEAMRGLAQNLLNDGQLDAAIEQYRLIAEADPQDAQAQLNIAEIYRRSGKFDQALESLKKAEGLVQDSLEVIYKRALIFESQGRFDEAVQLLQQLLQKTSHPNGVYTAAERNNRGLFLLQLGTVYRESNRHAQAIETFRKMLDLGDENAARGFDQIIETYRDQKQWPQATTAAQEAVSRFPNNRSLKLVLAGQLADSGQGDTGIAQARSLLKNAPEDREVWVALSTIYTRLRRFKEAEESLDKAEQLSSRPEERDYIVFLRGSLFERQKKYDQAEDAFKRVLVGDPNHAMVLNYLGYMLADRGVRLDEALGYIKKAIEIDPQNGAYLDSLGWVHFRLGNYDLAEEYLRKASAKISNDATIQDHLGDLYQKTGRLKLAAAHWERALDEWSKSVPADVDQVDVARVQKKLESAKVKLAKEAATSSNNNKQ